MVFSPILYHELVLLVSFIRCIWLFNFWRAWINPSRSDSVRSTCSSSRKRSFSALNMATLSLPSSVSWTNVIRLSLSHRVRWRIPSASNCWTWRVTAAGSMDTAFCRSDWLIWPPVSLHRSSSRLGLTPAQRSNRVAICLFKCNSKYSRSSVWHLEMIKTSFNWLTRQ